MNTNDSINVTVRFDCNLMIKTDKIVDFGVELRLTVAGHPGSTVLNFRIRSHSQTVNFIPTSQYKLENKILAEAMVSDCLNRLYEGNLFGSGWPQSPPRDYPHFRVF